MIIHYQHYNILIMIASIKSIDAVARVKKYLVAASVNCSFALFFIKMAIMASMFISSPVLIINQCELNMIIMVPIKRGLISMERI